MHKNDGADPLQNHTLTGKTGKPVVERDDTAFNRAHRGEVEDLTDPCQLAGLQEMVDGDVFDVLSDAETPHHWDCDYDGEGHELIPSVTNSQNWREDYETYGSEDKKEVVLAKGSD